MAITRTKIADWLRSVLILLEDSDFEKNKGYFDNMIYCASEWLKEVHLDEKEFFDNFKKECIEKDKAELNDLKNINNLTMQ